MFFIFSISAVLLEDVRNIPESSFPEYLALCLSLSLSLSVSLVLYLASPLCHLLIDDGVLNEAQCLSEAVKEKRNTSAVTSRTIRMANKLPE